MKKMRSDILNNRKISRIKKLAIDLYSTNQITKHLCALILKCDYKDEIFVQFLIHLSEKYMRVRGYYKKYPFEIDMVNQEIDLAIKKFNEERGNN